MNRRAFLTVSGRTMTIALAAGADRTERLVALEQPRTPRDGLEQRVAAAIQAYDAGKPSHGNGGRQGIGRVAGQSSAAFRRRPFA